MVLNTSTLGSDRQRVHNTYSLSLYHSLSVLCEHAPTSLPVENRRETMEEDEDKLRTEIDKINNLLLTCTVYYLLYALY